MIRIFANLTLCLLIATTALAQSGQLDASFANNGIFLMDLQGGSEAPHEVLVQSDGKLVVAVSPWYQGGFDFAAVRLHENGTVDSSFAENGVFQYENANGSDILYDAELLDDGTILLAGSYAQEGNNTDFFIMKLTTDGELDTSFGVDGLVIQEIDTGLDYGREMTITPDGQIAVCGYSHIPGGGGKLDVIIMLNSDGSLDTNFGTEGMFLWNDIGISTEMYSITMANDGNFLVTGFAQPAGADRIAVYKVLADGSGLDLTFGTNGEILPPIEGKARSIRVHENGNIMVAGYGAASPLGTNYVLLAYRENGTLNTDFGIDGIFYADVHPADYGTGMAIQTDGKIIICGESGTGPFGLYPNHFTTVRCDAAGILDTSWGDMGVVETITAAPGLFAFPNGITIQPADGKVLITGPSAYSEGHDLTVVRYGNYIDADEDGSPLGEDCNDAVASIFPGNEETVYNGIDDDCDPATLDDDLDQDGFVFADDCDDMNAAISPDNVEIPYNGIDDDCDPATLDDDLDQDGFVLADDCDDMNADINPDAIEILDNGIDEDCDGMDNITSVRESVLSSQFMVFPNPANDVVYVRSETTGIEVLGFEITDISGRQLNAIIRHQSTGQVEISLAGLPAGMLILKMETSKGIVVKRIVKK